MSDINSLFLGRLLDGADLYHNFETHPILSVRGTNGREDLIQRLGDDAKKAGLRVISSSGDRQSGSADVDLRVFRERLDDLLPSVSQSVYNASENPRGRGLLILVNDFDRIYRAASEEHDNGTFGDAQIILQRLRFLAFCAEKPLLKLALVIGVTPLFNGLQDFGINASALVRVNEGYVSTFHVKGEPILQFTASSPSEPSAAPTHQIILGGDEHARREAFHRLIRREVSHGSRVTVLTATEDYVLEDVLDAAFERGDADEAPVYAHSLLQAAAALDRVVSLIETRKLAGEDGVDDNDYTDFVFVEELRSFTQRIRRRDRTDVEMQLSGALIDSIITSLRFIGVNGPSVGVLIVYSSETEHGSRLMGEAPDFTRVSPEQVLESNDSEFDPFDFIARLFDGGSSDDVLTDIFRGIRRIFER